MNPQGLIGLQTPSRTDAQEWVAHVSWCQLLTCTVKRFQECQRAGLPSTLSPVLSVAVQGLQVSQGLLGLRLYEGMWFRPLRAFLLAHVERFMPSQCGAAGLRVCVQKEPPLHNRKRASGILALRPQVPSQAMRHHECKLTSESQSMTSYP